MKRLFTILLVALMAVPVFSQKKDVYEGFDIYNLGASQQKKGGLAFDLGIGSELEMGFRYQRNFGKYFAWDIFGIKYAWDYCEDEIKNSSYGYYYMANGSRHELTLQTGFRGFTPSFSSGKMKAFAHLGMGYGASSRYWKNPSISLGETEWGSHFAFDFTIGLQFKDKFSIGYGFGKLFGDGGNNGDDTDHLVRFGLLF